MTTIIFTGVSGAGKTTALRAVEDLGFYCVDNLPQPLLDAFLDTMKQEPGVDHVALVADARLRHYIAGYAESYVALTARGFVLEVVYLDATDTELTRRFSQTRRRHPLSSDDLLAGLAEERRLLAPMRALASVCIDSTTLTVHQLKQLVQDRYQRGTSGLVVSLLSFGFRYGVPSHADLVLDVRFLPNPFFIKELQDLSGEDAPVADYVLKQPDAVEFNERTGELLEFLLPRYQAEGKVYLTIAVGCTGGRHRSVAIVEALAQRLGEKRAVRVRHRDVQR
ncbi:MAG: RNase adapter RapZ [Proteobacteria bacterium]|nr:RNase adapter RapZ [Pseudomonadota bacterium]